MTIGAASDRSGGGDRGFGRRPGGACGEGAEVIVLDRRQLQCLGERVDDCRAGPGFFSPFEPGAIRWGATEPRRLRPDDHSRRARYSSLSPTASCERMNRRR
jgi:hypothetical protein